MLQSLQSLLVGVAIGLPVKTRITWLAAHKLAVLGFGFSCALVQLIPVLNFIVLPAALLGSTRLVWHIEQYQLNPVATPPES